MGRSQILCCSTADWGILDENGVKALLIERAGFDALLEANLVIKAQIDRFQLPCALLFQLCQSCSAN